MAQLTPRGDIAPGGRQTLRDSNKEKAPAPTEEELREEEWLFHSLLRLSFKTLLAPLTRLTVLQQCESWLLENGKISRRSTNLFDCLIRTVQDEGVLSLWKGHFWTVLEHFGQEYLKSIMEDVVVKALQVKEDIDKGRFDSAKADVLIAQCPAISAKIYLWIAFCAPLDLLAQIDAVVPPLLGPPSLFPSVIDIIRKSWRDSYCLGLYSYTMTKVDFFAAALHAGFYRLFDLLLRNKLFASIPSGLRAILPKTLANAITFPLGTLSRWTHVYHIQYNKAIFKTVFADATKGGILSLYSGSTTYLLQGLLWLAYEPYSRHATQFLRSHPAIRNAFLFK